MSFVNVSITNTAPVTYVNKHSPMYQQAHATYVNKHVPYVNTHEPGQICLQK